MGEIHGPSHKVRPICPDRCERDSEITERLLYLRNGIVGADEVAPRVHASNTAEIHRLTSPHYEAVSRGGGDVALVDQFARCRARVLFHY